jgi:hypothetical protein
VLKQQIRDSTNTNAGRIKLNCVWELVTQHTKAVLWYLEPWAESTADLVTFVQVDLRAVEPGIVPGGGGPWGVLPEPSGRRSKVRDGCWSNQRSSGLNEKATGTD